MVCGRKTQFCNHWGKSSSGLEDMGTNEALVTVYD